MCTPQEAAWQCGPARADSRTLLCEHAAPPVRPSGAHDKDPASPARAQFDSTLDVLSWSVCLSSWKKVKVRNVWEPLGLRFEVRNAYNCQMEHVESRRAGKCCSRWLRHPPFYLRASSSYWGQEQRNRTNQMLPCLRNSYEIAHGFCSLPKLPR